MCVTYIHEVYVVNFTISWDSTHTLLQYIIIFNYIINNVFYCFIHYWRRYSNISLYYTWKLVFSNNIYVYKIHKSKTFFTVLLCKIVFAKQHQIHNPSVHTFPTPLASVKYAELNPLIWWTITQFSIGKT